MVTFGFNASGQCCPLNHSCCMLSKMTELPVTYNVRSSGKQSLDEKRIHGQTHLG